MNTESNMTIAAVLRRHQFTVADMRIDVWISLRNVLLQRIAVADHNTQTRTFEGIYEQRLLQQRDIYILARIKYLRI